MILFLLSTPGISQDNLCLPREQIEALYTDVIFLTSQTEKLDSLNLLYKTVTNKQDSIIVNLEEQVALQDSIINEMDLDKEDPWYLKYLYLIIGIGITKI